MLVLYDIELVKEKKAMLIYCSLPAVFPWQRISIYYPIWKCPSVLTASNGLLLDVVDLKQYKHLLRCKKVMWTRWSKEYLHGLRQRHAFVNKVKKKEASGTLQVGDVVIVKSEQRNWGKWQLGIVEHLITGRDWVTRGAKLHTGKSNLERPVQFLYPLELSGDLEFRKRKQAVLNPNVPVFRPKSSCWAAYTRDCRTWTKLWCLVRNYICCKSLCCVKAAQFHVFDKFLVKQGSVSEIILNNFSLLLQESVLPFCYWNMWLTLVRFVWNKLDLVCCCDCVHVIY